MSISASQDPFSNQVFFHNFEMHCVDIDDNDAAFVIENCMVEILTTSSPHVAPILNTNRGFHKHTKLAILAKVSQLTA